MKKQQENKELGFGTKGANQKARLINRTGSFNVNRTEPSKWHSISVYHALLLMSWRKFNLIVLAYFFIINLFFTAFYFIVGIDGLNGIEGIRSETDKILNVFFFSTQTLSTVGFGRISPVSHLVSAIAAVESLVGLLGFAIATGLLYGRFSRPQAHIIFSKNAIIAPFKDATAFQFRIVNKMSNSQITDMEARIIVAKFEIENGVKIRRFRQMDLELNKITFFPLSWTVNHPINENSPIYGMSFNDLKEVKAEFLIILNGFDDTFSQTVHRRYSYTIDELVCGAKFTSIFSENEKGEVVQNINKISDYELIENFVC
jgi:inward rectifier potassium channel